MSYQNQLCLTLSYKWCLTKINSVLLSCTTDILLEPIGVLQSQTTDVLQRSTMSYSLRELVSY
jgi:hypothetical protein